MLEVRTHDLQYSTVVGEPGRASVFKILEQTLVRFPAHVAKDDSIRGGPPGRDGHGSNLNRRLPGPTMRVEAVHQRVARPMTSFSSSTMPRRRAQRLRYRMSNASPTSPTTPEHHQNQCA